MFLPVFQRAGHFPWLMSLMKYFFAYTEPGKAAAYVQKVALDLIKARRENGRAEKVSTNVSSPPLPLSFKLFPSYVFISDYHALLSSIRTFFN